MYAISSRQIGTKLGGAKHNQERSLFFVHVMIKEGTLLLQLSFSFERDCGRCFQLSSCRRQVEAAGGFS
jgi:hypothetical protein